MTAAGPPFSPTAFFALTTRLNGRDATLQAGPVLGEYVLLHTALDAAGGAPLAWQITAAPTTVDCWSLCANVSMGSGGSFGSQRYLCRDVFAEEKHTLRLGTPGYYAGQQWAIRDGRGDGTYRLTNQWSGPDLHLDAESNSGRTVMADGDGSGQRWSYRELAVGQAPPMPRSPLGGMTTTKITPTPLPGTLAPTKTTMTIDSAVTITAPPTVARGSSLGAQRRAQGSAGTWAVVALAAIHGLVFLLA